MLNSVKKKKNHDRLQKSEVIAAYNLLRTSGACTVLPPVYFVTVDIKLTGGGRTVELLVAVLFFKGLLFIRIT